MVITLIPPLWTDRDDCFRCHTAFSAFNRKHHCRACGETFCAICSSKKCPLTEYGVTEDVRVCVTCFDRIQSTGSIRSQCPSPPKLMDRNQNALKEEEAFQLALTLSRSEAEEKERQKKLLTQQYFQSTDQHSSMANSSAPSVNDVENDYWETQTKNDLITIKPLYKDQLDQYVRDEDIDAFVHAVNGHINNIKFRMLSNQQRGRNIANDTAVQSVFILLQHMYPELIHLMKLLADKQSYYEDLQDKLNQLKDAREALNALREDHSVNKRQQALDRERQRQFQLAMKLDDLRLKKHVYLEYQRQLHLQRLTEQEAEMQARLNQQRLYIQQRQQPNQVLNVLPSSANYYQSITNPISMGQLSHTLPTVPPAISSQNSYSYLQQNRPQTPPVSSNEQTLISLD